MPTHCNETLQQRYQRERDDYLKALAKYTPEQIAAVEVDLHNAAATIAQLRAVLRGLVDDIQGLIAESDGVAGLHRNGDVAPWGELEAGGQFERLSHLPAAIEAAQCSEVGRKCSEQCAELPAPPVPRDVLMAAMTEVRRTQMKIVREGLQGGRWAEDIDDAVSQVDIAAIADHYASEVRPEPVNQQLLAALKRLLHKAYKQNWQDNYPSEVGCAEAAIAAAQAAQPVVSAAQKFATSEAGRKYVADFFAKTLRRHDFTSYINERLAADFACVLAGALSGMQPASAQPVDVPCSQAALDVLAERRRQIEAEGWTPENDDKYLGGQLAAAAAAYAMTGCHSTIGRICPPKPPGIWPWDQSWWKPSTTRRDLVKAAALLLAEIERIDRAAAQKPEGV